MTYNIQLTISDAKGDQSVMSIPLPSATSVEDAQLMGEAIIPLVEALSIGVLRDARLAIPLGFTPWSSVSPIADVQEKGRFVFRTENGNVKSLTIPCWDETFMVPGTKEIDTTAPGVVATFVAAMIDGIDLVGVGGSGTVEPCDTREEDITELDAAVEAWGKARG